MSRTKLSELKAGQIARLLRVKPGARFRLKDHRTDWREAGGLRDLGSDELKEKARAYVERSLESLAESQELLYASDRYSVLVILQAMDAAGKDGIIKHVMSGLNPQGCQVYNFKKPSDEDLDHNFLWRYSKCLPERGRIGIFNRSYYEETLVVRVHPELLERQKLPVGEFGRDFWKARYEDINNFERHLMRNGTLILKFFLNVSKAEQKKRFQERLTNPEKHWKFSPSDLAEREHWDAYQEAFEETISATSTKWAPWYVVPSDHKWIARATVSAVIKHGIKSLGLQPPVLSAEHLKALAAARRRFLPTG
jgi:PPK2 family polyphosphate:nucleotide phosphotransferase